MRVSIFPAVDTSFSIDRYARELALNFPIGIDVRNVKFKRSAGLWGKVIDEHFKHLWIARKEQGDYNIIVNLMYSFLLLVLNKHRTLIICHDLHPLLDRCPAGSLWMKFRIKAYQLRFRINLRLMKNAHLIVTVSDNTREELLRFCPYIRPENVVTLHNGIESWWIALEDDGAQESFRRKYGLTHKRVILHVGNDNWYKNFQALLRAFKILENPDLVLLKLGDIGPANRLLIHELGIEDRVIHIKAASDEELRVFYNLSDMLVFPSSHEGFGWPPLEAMGCGCPVITSRVSSLPEVCGDACIYVDPFDTKGIADAIRELLANSSLRAQLTYKGKCRAKQFSWRRTTAQMLELLGA